MPHTSIPWCMNTRFFLTFFQENPIALKSFCAALLSIPDSQIISCSLRSPAYPAKSDYIPHSCSQTLSVIIQCPHPLQLDIVSPSFTAHSLFANDHPFPLLPSSVPLLPSTPFLKVHLFYPQQAISFPLSLYSETRFPTKLCTSRFLHLSLQALPLLHTPLSDFARLLLVKHSFELPRLIASSPSLTPIIPLLEEYLRNQEINTLFQKNTDICSPEGIQAMCSLNRLLLKEKRVSDLWEASRNPDVLLELFQEYHRKGYL